MAAEETNRLRPSNGKRLPSGLSDSGGKRLPVFIAENIKSIVGEWEDFARTLTPSSSDMSPLALRDHIFEILQFVVDDINSAQTPKEETIKSRGKKDRSPKNTAAETHAALRLTGGFDIDQMTSEYRALRASVIKLWKRTNPCMDETDFTDLTRFNESIDQVLTESVSYYADEVFRSKDLFVGILGHDLRNPVQAIMLSAELMLHIGTLNERQTMLTKNVFEGAARINKLIDNLLDVTRARFGAGLSIIRSPMNMGFVGHQIIDEMRIIHPSCTIVLDFSGDLAGEWDKARIGQVFSNLLGNAIQYGFRDTPINVVINGDLEAVTLVVQNNGVPIAPNKIGIIFNPLTRAMPDQEIDPVSVNLGLGLFITHEVIVAHGGTVHVTSSEEKGTTFTARFPRFKSAPTLHLA
jgi:signal transduction histidine kinase